MTETLPEAEIRSVARHPEVFVVLETLMRPARIPAGADLPELKTPIRPYKPAETTAEQPEA